MADTTGAGSPGPLAALSCPVRLAHGGVAAVVAANLCPYAREALGDEVGLQQGKQQAQLVSFVLHADTAAQLCPDLLLRCCCTLVRHTFDTGDHAHGVIC